MLAQAQKCPDSHREPQSATTSATLLMCFLRWTPAATQLQVLVFAAPMLTACHCRPVSARFWPLKCVCCVHCCLSYTPEGDFWPQNPAMWWFERQNRSRPMEENICSSRQCDLVQHPLIEIMSRPHMIDQFHFKHLCVPKSQHCTII